MGDEGRMLWLCGTQTSPAQLSTKRPNAKVPGSPAPGMRQSRDQGGSGSGQRGSWRRGSEAEPKPGILMQGDGKSWGAQKKGGTGLFTHC